MIRFALVAVGLSLGMLALVGCDPKTDTGTGKDTKGKDTKGKGTSPLTSAPTTNTPHNHSGWWCEEHGVKEADCSMCDPKVAKAYQDKGDWCKEHERAKSQCFLCDPKLEAKFAAEYKTKYGKEPPKPDGQKPEKK